MIKSLFKYEAVRNHNRSLAHLCTRRRKRARKRATPRRRGGGKWGGKVRRNGRIPTLFRVRSFPLGLAVYTWPCTDYSTVHTYIIYGISRRRVVDARRVWVRFLLLYPVSTDPHGGEHGRPSLYTSTTLYGLPTAPTRPYPPTPTTTLPLYPCPCPLAYTSSRYVTTVGDRRWPFVRCSLCHPSPMNLDRPSCINLDRPSSINLDRVSCIISIGDVHQSRSTRCINLGRRAAWPRAPSTPRPPRS